MSVHVIELPNGDLQLGAEVDGQFVPFAFQSAARRAQYVQRAQDLAERAAAGDELARDQIGKPLGSSKKKGATSKADEGEGE